MCCNECQDDKSLALSTNGWTPQFSILEVDEGYVIRVSNWIGGSKNKPISPLYIGDEGLVTNLLDATVIPSGEGAVLPITSDNITF